MFEPPYRAKNMMPGMIMLWYGTEATIPSGWHVCDGTMGTPDLRAVFVRGAGGPFTPGDTGGSAVHTHDFTGDGHSHVISAGSGLSAGLEVSNTTDSSGVTGTTDDGNNLPNYHQLCYIMKL